MENGELNIKGQTEAQQQAAKLEWKRQEVRAVLAQSYAYSDSKSRAR